MIEIRHNTIIDSSRSQFAYDKLYALGGIDLSDSYYLWLLEKMDLIPGKVLIDISCGRGKLAAFAKKKGLYVIGLDFSLSAIKAAQQIDSDLNLVVSDGEKIALKEECADYITHIGNLEHYQNPSMGIQEIARLLKNDGIAVILLPNGFSIAGNIQHVRKTGQVFDDGQPTKRKAQGGGQSIAALDIYTFLTYDANNIMSELLGPRSDEHRSKREMYNSIIETGEMPSIPEVTKSGGTRDVFDLYITGMGLNIV